MRSVVAVAPDATTLAALYNDLPLTAPAVQKVPGLPFLLAESVVG
jgi:hypothetical protein